MGLSQSHEYSASEMGALTFLWLLRKIISEGQSMETFIGQDSWYLTIVRAKFVERQPPPLNLYSVLQFLLDCIASVLVQAKIFFLFHFNGE